MHARTALPVLLLSAVACASPELGTDLSLREEASPATELAPSTDQPLRIAAPTDGQVIAGNALQVDLAGPVTMPDTGAEAYAVLVDTRSPAPGSRIVSPAVWSDSEPIVLAGLSSGSHSLTIVHADGDGLRVGDAEATVDVRVLGPTLQASAPRTVDAGRDLVIDLVMDPDTDGTLQVMVDPVAPPTAGQRIADSGSMATDVTRDGHRLTLGSLEPGAHSIWVVVTSDGFARDPLVAGRVDVDVG